MPGLMDPPVARKQTEKPAEKKRKDVLTRIYPDALEDAKRAASFLGVPLVDYLTAVVKEAAARDIEEGFARWKQARPKK